MRARCVTWLDDTRVYQRRTKQAMPRKTIILAAICPKATRAAAEQPDRPDSEHPLPQFYLSSVYPSGLSKGLKHLRSAVARIADPLSLHFAFCTSIRSLFWLVLLDISTSATLAAMEGTEYQSRNLVSPMSRCPGREILSLSHAEKTLLSMCRPIRSRERQCPWAIDPPLPVLICNHGHSESSEGPDAGTAPLCLGD